MRKKIARTKTPLGQVVHPPKKSEKQKDNIWKNGRGGGRERREGGCPGPLDKLPIL